MSLTWALDDLLPVPRGRATAGRARAGVQRALASFPSRACFGSFLTESWLPARHSNLRPSTFARYQREIARHINPAIGHGPSTGSAPHTYALYEALLDHGRIDGRGLAPKTVLNIHQILRAALGDAWRRGLVARNEALLAHPLALRARFCNKPAAWTARQLTNFLYASRWHRFWSAIHLAATTGMRRGEILGLRWVDIDFDANRVSVHRTLAAIADETAESTVKIHHSRRVIDLAPDTIAVFARGVNDASKKAAMSSPTTSIFARVDGSGLHPHTLSQAFERLTVLERCADLPASTR